MKMTPEIESAMQTLQQEHVPLRTIAGIEQFGQAYDLLKTQLDALLKKPDDAPIAEIYRCLAIGARETGDPAALQYARLGRQSLEESLSENHIRRFKHQFELAVALREANEDAQSVKIFNEINARVEFQILSKGKELALLRLLMHSYKNLGIAYLKLNEYERAVHSFHVALRYIDQCSGALDLFRPALKNYLALATFKYGAQENGLRLFDEANALFKQHPECLPTSYDFMSHQSHYGRALCEAGRYQEAITLLFVAFGMRHRHLSGLDRKKVAEVAESLANAYFQSAKVYCRGSEFREACHFLEIAQEEYQSLKMHFAETAPRVAEEASKKMAHLHELQGQYRSEWERGVAQVVPGAAALSGQVGLHRAVPALVAPPASVQTATSIPRSPRPPLT